MLKFRIQPGARYPRAPPFRRQCHEAKNHSESRKEVSPGHNLQFLFQFTDVSQSERLTHAVPHSSVFRRLSVDRDTIAIAIHFPIGTPDESLPDLIQMSSSVMCGGLILTSHVSY